MGCTYNPIYLRYGNKEDHSLRSGQIPSEPIKIVGHGGVCLSSPILESINRKILVLAGLSGNMKSC
jgi:hypothetical protein